MSAPEMPDVECMTCSQARAEVSMAVRPLCRGLPLRQARRLQEDALLVASELVANAIRHAGGVTRFSACVHDGVLIVRVSDRSATAPHQLPVDPSQPGGFGWLMVQHLSRDVRVETHEHGKTITATLPV